MTIKNMCKYHFPRDLVIKCSACVDIFIVTFFLASYTSIIDPL